MIMDDIDNLAKKKNIRWRRICFCFFSIIFMAAAGIGIASAVVGANRSHDTNDEDDQNGSSSDSISTICAETDYKDECIAGLSTALLYDSSVGRPMELIKTTFGLTIYELEKALNLTIEAASTQKNSTDSMKLQSLIDCRELLQYAIEELQDCMNAISSIDLKELPNRRDDLRNWLGAVLSYQSSCVDGLRYDPMNTTIQNGVINATKLTSNTLAIVTEITSILTNLHSGSKLSRKLTENDEKIPCLDHQQDRTGYPSWFELRYRKLIVLHDSGKVTPNAVVAKDGSGQFITISAALEAMTSQYEGSRYVIYVKEGIYEEQVIVTKKMKNVLMYGDGPRKTIVTCHKNFVDGTTTYQTATFAAIGDGFIAKSMGFRNTAGAAKNQSVALRVQSDKSAFFDCLIDGFQNTLHAQAHRQFYKNCVISGTRDFIFGDSATFLQNCTIFVKRPMDHQQNTITAQARSDKRSPTGIIIQNCQIVPHAKHSPVRSNTPTYLGRPLKQYSRSVVMESNLGELINPQGWISLDGSFALDTLFFAEYGNKGPGADTSKRVRWKGYKVITSRSEALNYTAGNFIQGGQWLKRVGIPYVLGLLN